MGRMTRSVATLDQPEFINLTPYTPLISKCEIKVFYLGENRNGSYISKEVAKEMANSLPGCPIVGYYKPEKEDFSDHGQRVVIDDEGVKFEVMTKPYGFVAPDAEVWFQKFEDTDEFGTVTIREYLMTNGYIWTGQFEEAQRIIDKGNNQSMELDEKTLNGKWATNHNTGVEFFIINDAIISKLAILGEDVEPCFEGASIEALGTASARNYSLDDDFRHTLFTMMEELKQAIENPKGGAMDNDQTPLENAEELETEFEAAEETVVEETVVEVEPVVEEVEVVEELTEVEVEVEFEALQTAHAEAQSLIESLQAQVAELQSFRNSIEDKEKDALIDSFYMLDPEDKAEVIANKSQYSLEDIEKELAVICVRKKVSFEVANEEVNETSPITTFNLDESLGSENVPAYVAKLMQKKNQNN